GVIFGWNPEIQKINDEFLDLQPPLIGQIVSFYERKKLWGIIRLIDKSSGVIASERVTNLPISKSHSQICIVRDKSDVVYLMVTNLARGVKARTGVGEQYFEVDSQILKNMFK